MKMMISSEVEITDYDGVFADWCESNLYVDNPEYNKKLRMGFWVGNTPKRIALYHKNGDKIYIPRGLADEVVKVFPQECLNYAGILIQFKRSFEHALLQRCKPRECCRTEVHKRICILIGYFDQMIVL